MSRVVKIHSPQYRCNHVLFPPMNLSSHRAENNQQEQNSTIGIDQPVTTFSKSSDLALLVSMARSVNCAQSCSVIVLRTYVRRRRMHEKNVQLRHSSLELWATVAELCEEWGRILTKIYCRQGEQRLSPEWISRVQAGRSLSITYVC